MSHDAPSPLFPLIAGLGIFCLLTRIGLFPFDPFLSDDLPRDFSDDFPDPLEVFGVRTGESEEKTGKDSSA